MMFTDYQIEQQIMEANDVGQYDFNPADLIGDDYKRWIDGLNDYDLDKLYASILEELFNCPKIFEEFKKQHLMPLREFVWSCIEEPRFWNGVSEYRLFEIAYLEQNDCDPFILNLRTMQKDMRVIWGYGAEVELSTHIEEMYLTQG
jgi:hypothetical protein